MYEIYTDGSCFPNPGGCGGWAFVVRDRDKIEHTESGHRLVATNNTMELTAIIKALEYTPKLGAVIYTDSKYAMNCINKWYGSWVKYGNLLGKKNLDLIELAVKLKHSKQAKIRWIKGHTGNIYNEAADALSDKEMSSLYQKVHGRRIDPRRIRRTYFKDKELRESAARPSLNNRLRLNIKCSNEHY